MTENAKERSCCFGCGSTLTIAEIRAENPAALSCCPEREMLSAAEWCERYNEISTQRLAIERRAELADAIATAAGEAVVAWKNAYDKQGKTLATLGGRVAFLETKVKDTRALVTRCLLEDFNPETAPLDELFANQAQLSSALRSARISDLLLTLNWQTINSAPTDKTEIIGMNAEGIIEKTWYASWSGSAGNWLKYSDSKPWTPVKWIHLPLAPMNQKEAQTAVRPQA